MANEIQVYAQLKCTNGNLAFNETTPQLSFDQTNVGGPTPGMVNIGITEETLDLSELTTLGWCIMRNLDATNHVEVGFSTGVYGMRLDPNSMAMFRINPGATVYMKANIAACKVIVNALEG